MAEDIPLHLLAIPPTQRKLLMMHSAAPTPSQAIEDDLDSFADDFLKLTFKKERAEAAKFAAHIKSRVDAAEAQAVARVSAMNKQLRNELATPNSGMGSVKDIEELEASVTALIDTVVHSFEAATGQIELDLDADRTLVNDASTTTQNPNKHTAAQPDRTHLDALEAALADRPTRRQRRVRKLIKQHCAGRRKRVERKQVGQRARELIERFASSKTAVGGAAPSRR